MQAVIQLCQAAAVDVNPCEDGCCFTPLEWACRKGHLDIVQFLVSEGGASVRAGAPVAWACYTNQLDIALWLVEVGGADPAANMKASGEQAVHRAASNGSLECLRGGWSRARE